MHKERKRNIEIQTEMKIHLEGLLLIVFFIFLLRGALNRAKKEQSGGRLPVSRNKLEHPSRRIIKNMKT